MLDANMSDLKLTTLSLEPKSYQSYQISSSKLPQGNPGNLEVLDLPVLVKE